MGSQEMGSGRFTHSHRPRARGARGPRRVPGGAREPQPPGLAHGLLWSVVSGTVGSGRITTGIADGAPLRRA